MEWYFYLHYFIYRYYKRKNDNMPAMYSIGGTVVLLCFNIFTIWMLYHAVIDFWTVPKPLPHYKIWIIGGMAILALLNYLILYRKKKYIEVFDEFQRNYDNYKKWDKSVKWYIILSIVFMLVTLYGSVLLRDYYVGDVRWI